MLWLNWNFYCYSECIMAWTVLTHVTSPLYISFQSHKHFRVLRCWFTHLLTSYTYQIRQDNTQRFEMYNRKPIVHRRSVYHDHPCNSQDSSEFYQKYYCRQNYSIGFRAFSHSLFPNVVHVSLSVIRHYTSSQFVPFMLLLLSTSSHQLTGFNHSFRDSEFRIPDTRLIKERCCGRVDGWI